jgi:hypothetical protein
VIGDKDQLYREFFGDEYSTSHWEPGYVKQFQCDPKSNKALLLIVVPNMIIINSRQLHYSYRLNKGDHLIREPFSSWLFPPSSVQYQWPITTREASDSFSDPRNIPAKKRKISVEIIDLQSWEIDCIEQEAVGDQFDHHPDYWLEDELEFF